MKKAYIFIYSDSFGTREEVKTGLNNIGIIFDWRHELPNSFYLTSESNAEEIAGKMRSVIVLLKN